MAEQPKKDTANASKIRKTRNELIRETLGQYLKHRNFVPAEKFRKSDLMLSQTKKQFMFNKMIDKDISKVNSFLYSNVLCITNNHSTVDLQFTKFVKFIESQPENIKNELSPVYGPLLCHLYIELLKGRDCKPASEFLRRHCHLVAPVENPNITLPPKLNGVAIIDDSTIPIPATTQITFLPDNTVNVVRDNFKNLIQILSQCFNCESLESNESVILFRSSKYELEISLEALNLTEKFLKLHGHLVILHILHTWINFEVSDLKDSDTQDSQSPSEPSVLDDEADTPEESIKPATEATETKEATDATKEESKPKVKKPDRAQIIKLLNTARANNGALLQKIPIDKRLGNLYLRRLQLSTWKLQKIEQPVRNIIIAENDRDLISVAIDKTGCHMVGGFNNSLVKLWQFTHSNAQGKNLYRKQCRRHCEWDSNNIEEEIESEDDEEAKLKLKSSRLNNKIDESKSFKDAPWIPKAFDEMGAMSLIGHRRGVTDVKFSFRHSVLLSVSKDHTMRLWKSTNYECGAIYRGHNYPIWCVDESPLGFYVATGARDLTARLWTLDRKFPLITYVGHTLDVDCIQFHPNGNYLATGSCDMSVRLWSVTTGRLFRVFTDCKYPVSRISFSPDGKYLAAGGEDSKVRIFDLAAGSQLVELKDHTAPVTDIVWNGSGRFLASGCTDGTVRIWDILKTGSSDDKTPNSGKLHSCLTYTSRPIKLSFDSNNLLTCIAAQ